MASDKFIGVAARHLSSKLHHSREGYRCRCGGCRHQILAASRRLGVAPRTLLAELPPERKPEEKRPRRRRPALTAQVSSAMTVSRGGNRLRGAEAALAVLGSRAS